MKQEGLPPTDILLKSKSIQSLSETSQATKKKERQKMSKITSCLAIIVNGNQNLS
jgi:hypothetical protein